MKLVFCLSVLLGAAELRAEQLTEQVDRLAAPYVESEAVMGMTIGVVRGDQTVVRGYGKLSAEDARVPDEKTIYEIGSVSKVFTGLLLADAVIESRVSLVTPVEDLLPKGVKMNRRHESLPIRLWHLATHTSGLPRLPDNLMPFKDETDPYAHYSGKKLAQFLADYQPRKRPGERHEYSNLGMGLLGDMLALERKTDYESLLQERITERLGLDDTAITLTEEQSARVATPHFEDGDTGYAWNFERLAGCGAIRSTTDDLLLLAKACLDPPEGSLGEAIDMAWLVHQKPLSQGDFAMGLGWHVARDGSTRWHNGQTGGYHAAVFINRELDAAVVLLTNTATMEVDTLAEQLIRMLAGSKEKPRQFKADASIDPKVVKRYEGTYQLAPGAVFTVKAKESQLFVGLTGQPSFRVFPRSKTEWYYKVVDATLTFTVDADDKATAVTLFQNGVRQTAKRTR